MGRIGIFERVSLTSDDPPHVILTGVKNAADVGVLRVQEVRLFRSLTNRGHLPADLLHRQQVRVGLSKHLS